MVSMRGMPQSIQTFTQITTIPQYWRAFMGNTLGWIAADNQHSSYHKWPALISRSKQHSLSNWLLFFEWSLHNWRLYPCRYFRFRYFAVIIEADSKITLSLSFFRLYSIWLRIGQCADNYYRKDCSVLCHRNVTCNDHGSCNTAGECLCDPGYYSTNCSLSCDCSGNGECNSDGTCSCYSRTFFQDWAGSTCDVAKYNCILMLVNACCSWFRWDKLFILCGSALVGVFVVFVIVLVKFRKRVRYERINNEWRISCFPFSSFSFSWWSRNVVKYGGALPLHSWLHQCRQCNIPPLFLPHFIVLLLSLLSFSF